MKRNEFEILKTPFEEDLNECVWQEYPRPQMRRESFLNLNGKWQFSIRKKDSEKDIGEILVPFPPESRISGIERLFNKNDLLIYRREFSLTDGFQNDRVLLHFGAVDQYCRVYINNRFVGEHTGGYIPFYFDITNQIKQGKNMLTVEVSDPLDIELPYGKQCKKRGGMWYTVTSGIWQTVWIESVPDRYIERIKITPDVDKVLIEVIGGDTQKTLLLSGESYSFENSIEIKIDHPICWTPDNPKLYNFTIISGKDTVKSYFALRKVEIKGKNILINGKPQFFHGLLDQGYFSDGIYLPATEKGFENDITTMKKLGFNMLRKHIKIEPEIFYYYCDKYGMFVFQDLVNSGKYNFFVDTALPTVGLKSGISHRASKKRRKAFETTAEETLDLLYNHPCVVYYTLFNEGWGQYDAVRLYKQMKSLDPTRVWDATSGWFQTGESDVLSEHIYFKPLKLKNDGRPLVLSEFGGYSYKESGHVFNTKNTYGYKFYKDIDEFRKGLYELYTEQVLPAIENECLCAAVLTQVSDVEDETNGLFTYDRQVLKVNETKMKEISKRLYKAYK